MTKHGSPLTNIGWLCYKRRICHGLSKWIITEFDLDMVLVHFPSLKKDRGLTDKKKHPISFCFFKFFPKKSQTIGRSDEKLGRKRRGGGGWRERERETEFSALFFPVRKCSIANHYWKEGRSSTVGRSLQLYSLYVIDNFARWVISWKWSILTMREHFCQYLGLIIEGGVFVCVCVLGLRNDFFPTHAHREMADLHLYSHCIQNKLDIGIPLLLPQPPLSPHPPPPHTSLLPSWGDQTDS